MGEQSQSWRDFLASVGGNVDRFVEKASEAKQYVQDRSGEVTEKAATTALPTALNLHEKTCNAVCTMGSKAGKLDATNEATCRNTCTTHTTEFKSLLGL